MSDGLLSWHQGREVNSANCEVSIWNFLQRAGHVEVFRTCGRRCAELTTVKTAVQPVINYVQALFCCSWSSRQIKWRTRVAWRMAALPGSFFSRGHDRAMHLGSGMCVTCLGGWTGTCWASCVLPLNFCAGKSEAPGSWHE